VVKMLYWAGGVRLSGASGWLWGFVGSGLGGLIWVGVCVLDGVEDVDSGSRGIGGGWIRGGSVSL
jgi:hypothetical protein